jgi:hypothetical protein
LMRLEPVAVVVLVEIAQEPEQLRSEICVAHAANIPIKPGLSAAETY